MMARAAWLGRFMGLAEQIATWSKDPTQGVGAVIARPDHTIASVGFNGFPRGCNDDPALYADRDVKRLRTVHAELNAILSAREPLHGYTIYSTGRPCSACAAAIIQAGISRVLYRHNPELESRWRESMDAGADLLLEAGIPLISVM